MKFNGVNINTLGRVSVKKERLPMVAQVLEPLETNTGLLLGHIGQEGTTFEAEVNIHARTAEEAGDTYLQLAAWAKGTGGLCRLEPTALPLKAYDAVFEEMDSPNLTNHRGTVRIRWLVTDPHPYSVMERNATTTTQEAKVWVNGTAASWPVFEITPEETQQGASILVDGQEVARYAGEMPGGVKLTIDMQHEKVLLGALEESDKMDWQHTDYTAMLAPGMRTVSCTAPGNLTVRWHDRWA